MEGRGGGGRGARSIIWNTRTSHGFPSESRENSFLAFLGGLPAHCLLQTVREEEGFASETSFSSRFPRTEQSPAA